MTAAFLRVVNPSARGSQRLYKVSPPVSYGYEDTRDSSEYVVVSAVTVFGEPETYIFPASEQGEIVDWVELDGSYKGGLDHEWALRNAGYEVVS